MYIITWTGLEAITEFINHLISAIFIAIFENKGIVDSCICYSSAESVTDGWADVMSRFI